MYQLYGLVIDSELPLPEAVEAPPQAPAEALVRLGDVASDGLPGGQRLGPFAWSRPGAVWLSVPGVARFLVRDGREIVVDPQPGVDDDTMRLFVLGSPLGVLLSQRGTFTLHGNGIRVGDGCLVCAGASGAGKSTLAAEFMRRGHQVLTDDLAPVDDECRVLPGATRLKLLPDAAKRLKISVDGARLVRPGSAKLDLDLGPAFCAEPVPLRWVYVLGGRGRELDVRTVRGFECMAPLRRHSYRLRFVKGMALLPEHLMTCGRIADVARVSVVTFPTRRIAPEAVVEALLADVSAHGG